MLQQILIGNLGADAEFKSENGHEFTAFRVGHNESWKDANGNKQTRTQWVDVVMNGKPNVLPYLKKGTMVFVIGSVTTRIYSSAKDHCMKAGLQISAQRVELLGGTTEAVPRQLVDSQGKIYPVQKWYHVDAKDCTLMSTNGQQFTIDSNGWCYPVAMSNVSANYPNESADAQVEAEPKTDDEPF